MLVRIGEGSQRSGSLGGTTYARNRFGTYARPRTVPVNPNTSRQNETRASLRNTTISWDQVLDSGQRDGWETYAANVPWLNRLGEEVRLTGIAMFTRSNAARSEADLPLLEDAPVIYELAESPILGTVAADVSAQTLSVGYDNTEGWANEDDGALLIYMGRPQNGSRTFYRAPWRRAGVVAGDGTTPPTSPLVVNPAPWTFGINNRIWVYARALRADGRLSEKTAVNFLSVA